MNGVKYDKNKPDMYLLPPRALLEVGKVLTYGANKYSPDNWRRLDSLQERYTSAALRHILADMADEENDEETEMSHLAHAICCLLFKLEDKLREKEDTTLTIGDIDINIEDLSVDYNDDTFLSYEDHIAEYEK
jgi:hypothetical protein